MKNSTDVKESVLLNLASHSVSGVRRGMIDSLQRCKSDMYVVNLAIHGILCDIAKTRLIIYFWKHC